MIQPLDVETSKIAKRVLNEFRRIMQEDTGRGDLVREIIISDELGAGLLAASNVPGFMLEGDVFTGMLDSIPEFPVHVTTVSELRREERRATAKGLHDLLKEFVDNAKARDLLSCISDGSVGGSPTNPDVAWFEDFCERATKALE